MRVIIDTNALRTDELWFWLKASSCHQAVLTDYAWMEIYKGDEKVALIESMKILRKFPDQVLMLKGTKAISAIDCRSAGYANAMVLPKAKANFSKTIEALEAVELSSPTTMKSVLQHGRVAKEHFSKMNGIAVDLSSYLGVVDAVFGKGATAEIRSTGCLSADFTRNFLFTVDEMYEKFVARHPAGLTPASRSHRINSFVWRYALAANLITKRYVAKGSNIPADERKIINEITDGIFVVYGTFFNGVMSSDKNLNGLYVEMEVILRRLGARLPTHYVEHPDTIAFLGLQMNETS